MSQITQNLIVGKKEDVTENLLLLSPAETPMINLVGFSNPVTQVEPTWFEDEAYLDKTKATATATTSDLTVKVADGSVFEAGYVVKINDELLLVTAVAGNDLTVTRGYANTTAGAIAVDDEVVFQFVEGKEGADARPARFKARKRVSNFTQIFDGTIQISGTAEATAQHGIVDLYLQEKAKKEKELALQLEKAIINGVKYEAPNGLTRQMGGLKHFIVTNLLNGAGADVSTDILNDAFQAIAEKTGQNVGAGYKIIVSPKQKRAISKMDVDKINLDRKDNGRGQVVDYFVGDFGEAEIVVNPNLAPDEILIIDTNRVSIRPLQGRTFTHEFLGKTGDYQTGMIVGEFTLELHQEKAHARIKNLKK